MIARVAAKAHNAIDVTDWLGSIKPLKKLNYVFAGGSKQDAIAVADPTAGYVESNILTFPDNKIYIVAKVTHDFFKAEVIRHTLELVLCNNTVTITRQIVQSNNQGGVLGHVDTELYANIPCKIIPAELSEDKIDDVFLNKYIVYFPSNMPIEINDKLQFAHTYSVGKAEGIKLSTLGLQEIYFDKDFRW